MLIRLLITFGLTAPGLAAAGTILRVGYFPNVTHAQGIIGSHTSRQGKGWFETRLGTDVAVRAFVEDIVLVAVDAGDGGPGLAARFNGPHNLAVLPDRDILIGDTWNGRVRRVSTRTGTVSTLPGWSVPADRARSLVRWNRFLAIAHFVQFVAMVAIGGLVATDRWTRLIAPLLRSVGRFTPAL